MGRVIGRGTHLSGLNWTHHSSFIRATRRIRCIRLEPISWIVLCHSAYGGARRGVEGLEFTGDVGPRGLVDDFGDTLERRVR